jgi:hypothetical protein
VFCLRIGLGREVAWWERTLWGLLAASFAWQTVTATIEARRRSHRAHAEETVAQPETAIAASRANDTDSSVVTRRFP